MKCKDYFSLLQKVAQHRGTMAITVVKDVQKIARKVDVTLLMELV